MKTRTLNHALLSAIGAMLIVASAGCAKNVDKIEFNKWGNSFVPNGPSMDLSTSGGAPSGGATNGTMTAPKAAVGGPYQRTYATSPNYRLVGGFHVNPSSR